MREHHNPLLSSMFSWVCPSRREDSWKERVNLFKCLSRVCTLTLFLKPLNKTVLWTTQSRSKYPNTICFLYKMAAFQHLSKLQQIFYDSQIQGLIQNTQLHGIWIRQYLSLPNCLKENKLSDFLKVLKGFVPLFQLLRQVDDIYKPLASGEAN